MELDTQIYDYMNKRARFAKAAAQFFAVCCFVLAGLFDIYGLYKNGLFYSESTQKGKIIIIIISIVLSLGMSVYGFMVTLLNKKLANKFPDDIGINQSRDVLEEAYTIAMPTLMLKITYSIIILLLSGLIYLLLMIFLDKSFMSGIYGRMIVYVALGIAGIIGIPCVDRIETYKAMLRKRYDSREGLNGRIVGIFAAFVTGPILICTWYIIRCYTDNGNIAWIVFPIGILFIASFVYLYQIFSEKSYDSKQLN